MAAIMKSWNIMYHFFHCFLPLSPIGQTYHLGCGNYVAKTQFFCLPSLTSLKSAKSPFSQDISNDRGESVQPKRCITLINISESELHDGIK
jgi:hypothetical protein